MRHLFLWTVAAAAAFGSPVSAQEKETKDSNPEFESSYNERFLKRSSFLGKQAPDVGVHDEAGNPFRLAQSRGKYTVVVFGCLT